MPQSGVFVLLRSISCSGGDIGAQTEFLIKANGQSTQVDSDIKAGETRSYKKSVLMSKTANKSQVSVTISVTVTEEDPVFNDTGSNAVSFTVKKANGLQTLPPLSVTVKESGALFGAATATFTFQFEAQFVGLSTKYVMAPTGWLRVRGEDGKDFSLPHLLEVETVRIKDREYLTAMEGPVRGRRGSISAKNSASSLSDVPVRHDPPIVIIYHKASRQVEVPGLGSFQVKNPPINDFPANRIFNLEIPDFPHPGGNAYTNQANYATSWFRIADPELPRRYLHTGMFSGGCATVLNVPSWDSIYRFLINRRKDGLNVGQVKVTAQ